MFYYEYKGYKGRAKKHKASGKILGCVLGIADYLSFVGDTEEEAREAFCFIVDEHIANLDNAEADYLDDYLMYGE